jgi:hypothetical protein
LASDTTFLTSAIAVSIVMPRCRAEYSVAERDGGGDLGGQGIEGADSPWQLRVFGDPHRDYRGWVLSVAHLDAVPASRLAIEEQIARLVPVIDVPPLRYGHEEIIELAEVNLRADQAVNPDPAGLVTEPFHVARPSTTAGRCGRCRAPPRYVPAGDGAAAPRHRGDGAGCRGVTATVVRAKLI